MSYMRSGHDLNFFKDGKSTLYVYGSKDGIEDYNAILECDDKNLIELIGRITFSETFGYKPGGAKFSYLIVEELSERMGLKDQLKPYDEVFDEGGYWLR